MKARGKAHPDEWLILYDMILSVAFLAAGLEAGEQDGKLRDVLDEFHANVAAAMGQAGVARAVVAGYEEKRVERFREYNPLIRQAGGSFASEAELALGRVIATRVGEPEHPTRVYAEFSTGFRITKESLDRLFARHAGLEQRVRALVRHAVGRFRHSISSPSRDSRGGRG